MPFPCGRTRPEVSVFNLDLDQRHTNMQCICADTANLTFAVFRDTVRTITKPSFAKGPRPMLRQIMPRPAIKLAFAGVLTAAALLATPAFAQTTPQVPQRTLSLTGQGEVKSAPDIAVISAGVVSEAKTAREALTLNNEAMASVLQTIEAAGVASKDIQTSSFSVQPRYKYAKRASDGEQEPPRITGYTVSNSVTVIARDLAKLGPVLDAVVSSGVNQMNGLSFSIAEPEPLRHEARKMAVAEARTRAEMYAEAAGVSLGKILSISEAGGQRPPQPEYRRAALQSAAADAVPVAQGQQSIQMQVNIVWEIE